MNRACLFLPLSLKRVSLNGCQLQYENSVSACTNRPIRGRICSPYTYPRSYFHVDKYCLDKLYDRKIIKYSYRATREDNLGRGDTPVREDSIFSLLLEEKPRLSSVGRCLVVSRRSRKHSKKRVRERENLFGVATVVFKIRPATACTRPARMPHIHNFAAFVRSDTS